MDPVLPLGMAIVAVALVLHLALVVVSRGIVEKMRRRRESTRG